MPNTYTLIASNTLGSSAASVTFSSIPNTYTDLVLKASIRSDRSAAFDVIDMFLNGDGTGTTKYSYTTLNSNGSTVSSSRYSSGSRWSNDIVDAATATSNTFSNTEMYIPSYTSSTNKVAGSFSVQEDNNATAYIRPQALLYSDTAVISSIKLQPANGTNWVSGSSFFLYGIKNS